jgi:hypothetical protein
VRHVSVIYVFFMKHCELVTVICHSACYWRRQGLFVRHHAPSGSTVHFASYAAALEDHFSWMSHWSLKLITNLFVGPKLWICGHMSYIFRLWCIIKDRDNFVFTFILSLIYLQVYAIWCSLQPSLVFLMLYILWAFVYSIHFLLCQPLHTISSRVFLLHVLAVTSSHLQGVNIKWFTQQHSIINGTSYTHYHIVIITSMHFKLQCNKIK